MWGRREKDDMELYREQRARDYGEGNKRHYSKRSSEPGYWPNFFTKFTVGLAFVILFVYLFFSVMYGTNGKCPEVLLPVKNKIDSFFSEPVPEEVEVNVELFTDNEIALLDNSYFQLPYLENVIRMLNGKEGVILLIQQYTEDGDLKYYYYGRGLAGAPYYEDKYGSIINNIEDVLISEGLDYYKFKKPIESLDLGSYAGNDSNWFNVSYINGVDKLAIYKSQFITDGSFENKIVGVIFMLTSFNTEEE